ncbi:MAG: T9SS type A sorting domain-containing protein, partial [Bacteroidota bacterium]
ISNSEGLPMQYDFRDVYGSILVDWFELEEEQVRSLLYQDFVRLPILEPCENITDTDDWEDLELEVQALPNPCYDGFTLSFQIPRAHLRITLFDSLGAVVRQLADKTLPQGRHQLQVDLSRLPAGAYFVRLQMGQKVQTKRVLKLG